jgi:hypothetical protein
MYSKEDLVITTEVTAGDCLLVIEEHIEEAHEHLKHGENQRFIDKIEHIGWHLTNLKSACATQHNLKPTPMK